MRTKLIISIFTGVVMAATLVASPVALAAVNMFLKIDGIEGESVFRGHEKEIDVLAWSWGASRSSKPDCVSVQDLSLTKFVDKASAKLITSLASGQAIANATLAVQKAGEAQTPYILIEMSNVTVSTLSTGGSGGEDRLTENVTLNFAALKYTYTPQLPTGQAGTPVVSTIATTCRKDK